MKYSIYNSPLGKLYIVATNNGICRLDWDVIRFQKNLPVNSNLTKDIFPGFGRSLDLYFRGYREDFDYPLDLIYLSPFTRTVLRKIRQIPYGKTKKYSELSVLIGRPGAQRAVANAAGRNPIPIIIPCHRVIGKESLGGYSGGMGTKLWLLNLEKSGIFHEIVSIITRLRQECPWDSIQTHESLIPYIKEECEEVISAIKEKKYLKEELGDLLLQVLLQSEIAKDFNILDVCEVLSSKLKTRHPHIFGNMKASTPEEVRKIWEEVKAKETRDHRPR